MRQASTTVDGTPEPCRFVEQFEFRFGPLENVEVGVFPKGKKVPRQGDVSSSQMVHTSSQLTLSLVGGGPCCCTGGGSQSAAGTLAEIAEGKIETGRVK